MKIANIELPKKKKLIGKTSIVPKILEKIPKGKMAIITNGEKETIDGQEYTLNTSSIRGYIKKQHKVGELTQYQIQSETIIDHTKENKKNTRLYITHETPKPDKKQES